MKYFLCFICCIFLNSIFIFGDPVMSRVEGAEIILAVNHDEDTAKLTVSFVIHNTGNKVLVINQDIFNRKELVIFRDKNLNKPLRFLWYLRQQWDYTISGSSLLRIVPGEVFSHEFVYDIELTDENIIVHDNIGGRFFQKDKGIFVGVKYELSEEDKMQMTSLCRDNEMILGNFIEYMSLPLHQGS